MKHKFVAALLLAVFLIHTSFGAALADPDTDDIIIKKGEQSDNVILLQMRLQDLGYYKYKITGYFGDLTKEALVDFQKNNKLSPDGIAGAKTLDLMYSNAAKRSPVVDVNPPPKPTPAKPKGKKGAMVSWKTVNGMWKRGTTCKVVDFNTGTQYYMKRVGGYNHADVAPIDKSSNKKFESTYRGRYPSWDRRAVVVYINGKGIAASTNGYPHGTAGVPNNGMSKGKQLLQVCIHFLNSKGHASGVIDAAHQYQTYRAAGKKPPMARTSMVYPGD